MEETLSKKQRVLKELFLECQRRGDWEFDNRLVRDIASRIGFGNPFDATKVDTSAGLPEVIRQQGYCVVHVGKGRHRFIPELEKWYHVFEDISQDEIITWRYRQSLLNDLDTGEASVLSFVYNQHILHDFLYEDVVASPKIYIPGRTKLDLHYTVGNTQVTAERQQMEMDLALEYLGTVTVLEAKNSFRRDFAVYQLFHPFRFYWSKSKQYGIPIANINACYVLKQTGRKQADGMPRTKVRLYLYTFDDPNKLDSLRLVRKAEYRLQRR